MEQNTKQNPFIVFLLSILPMAVAIGIQFAVQVPIIFFVVFKIMAEHADIIGTDEFALVYNTEIQKALLDPVLNDVLKLATMLVLAVVFVIWFFKSRASKGMTSVKKALPLRNIVLIVLAGFVTQIAMSMLLTLILPLFTKVYEQYSQLMDGLVGGNPVVAFVTVAILAPIAEELIFRGLTLRGTIRHWENFLLVNTLQALYFGIYHMNIVQGVYAFIMGLIFGYVAYRLNNILASMLFHASVNASGLFLFLPESLFEHPYVMIIVAIAASALLWAMIYLLKIPGKEAPAAPAPVVPGPVYGPGYGMPDDIINRPSQNESNDQYTSNNESDQ